MGIRPKARLIPAGLSHIRPRTSSGPLIGPLALGAAGGVLLFGLAGCLDIAFVRDVAFPASVPGLPADRPWVSLPLGAALSEGPAEARAIAVCSPPECAAPAVVGLFRIRDPETATRLAGLGDVSAAERLLSSEKRRTDALWARFRARGPRPVPSRVTLHPFGSGGIAGRIGRTDGSRPAAIVALPVRDGGQPALVVAVAGAEGSAAELARAVAGALAP